MGAHQLQDSKTVEKGICDPPRQNQSECAQVNYQLEARKWKIAVVVEFEIFTKTSAKRHRSTFPKLQIVNTHLILLFIWAFFDGYVLYVCEYRYIYLHTYSVQE